MGLGRIRKYGKRRRIPAGWLRQHANGWVGYLPPRKRRLLASHRLNTYCLRKQSLKATVKKIVTGEM